ncbi:MAG TPA: hypothetical protein VF677_11425 [Flavobacterium sp.]|jgi:hypothetical protein
MKIGQLVIGLLLGGLFGFGLTKYFAKTKQLTDNTKTTKIDSSSSSAKWTWPGSLDALKAAPDNHKVVYEDDNVRVLAVILNGKKSEPIHTHKWKSIMWIAKPIVPCQINNYVKDENGNLIKSDSLIIKEMPVDIGQLINPEGPTSITNLGSENGVAYRVEFKKDFKP